MIWHETNSFLDNIKTKITIRELGRGVSGINVYSIERDLVFGLKDKYKSILLVVVLCHDILQLSDNRFSFFK